MRKLLSLALVLAVGSCNKDKKKAPTEGDQAEAEEGPAAAAPVVVEEIDFAGVPEGAPVPGAFLRGITYRDAGGTAALLLSERAESSAEGETHRLFATLVQTPPGGKTTIVRTVRDGETDCELDLMVGFLDETWVTDLDGDRIGEVTFAYDRTCASDVSPMTRKLIVLEGKDKYIARGTTRVDPGDGPVGGDYELGEELEQGPAVFRQHVEEKWAELLGTAAAAAPTRTAIAGKYEMTDGRLRGELAVGAPEGGDFAFALEVTGGPPGYNVGSAEGQGTLLDSGARGTYRSCWEEEPDRCCELSFVFSDDEIEIESKESGACELGAGTHLDGTYARTSTRPPKPEELTLD